MHRRDVLRFGLGGVFGLSRFGGTASRGIPVHKEALPRINGGINVQPLRRMDPDAGLTPPLIVPEFVDAQLRTVYELGFSAMRVTLSFGRFGPDFLAAIPYVRAARALGIDVVGVMGQFTGFDLVQALVRRETRDEVLETYARIFGGFVPKASKAVERPGRFSLQVLNEPTHFLGLAPGDYVRDFLKPAYLHLKEDDPSLTVVSAATVGSADGVLRLRAMVEAGVELHCDRLAYHVYSLELLDELDRLSEKPALVTESGAGSTRDHLEWWTRGFDRIRAELENVTEIFWFHLFDFVPGGFRLVDLRPRRDLGFDIVPESTLAVELRSRVAEASGKRPTASYRELVPDVQMYFPTEEDLDLVGSTSFA